MKKDEWGAKMLYEELSFVNGGRGRHNLVNQSKGLYGSRKTYLSELIWTSSGVKEIK